MKKPVALGANIFAGGFSLGVSKHFKLLGHLEHDDYGAMTARKNLNIPIHIGVDLWPAKIPGGLDFLYANPPCAVWSVAGGNRDNWRNDPRLQRIRDIFTLVDRYKPKVWCWESVCQAFERGRSFVEELAAEAIKRKYAVSYLMIDAVYLGVPQRRKRFFLVLHRIDIDWKKATPDFNSKPVTVGQALRGIKPNKSLQVRCCNTDLKIIKYCKPGEKLKDVFDRRNPKPKIGSRGQRLGRPGFLRRRLSNDQVSNVVFGDTFFHPKDDRLLAVNEVGALCGFPQTWDWSGTVSDPRVVNRGVMPPVGEWLAKQVAAAVRKNKPAKPLRTLVDFRVAPGVIETVAAIPKGVDLDWKPQRLLKGKK